MTRSKSLRPDLKVFGPPREYPCDDHKTELTLYRAMYANRKNLRLIKGLSADIESEIEKLINNK